MVLRRVSLALLSTCVLGLSLTLARAQEPDEIAPKVGPADRAAAAQATLVYRHAKPTSLPTDKRIVTSCLGSGLQLLRRTIPKRVTARFAIPQT